jgi:hypothetical protein
MGRLFVVDEVSKREGQKFGAKIELTSQNTLQLVS